MRNVTCCSQKQWLRRLCNGAVKIIDQPRKPLREPFEEFDQVLRSRIIEPRVAQFGDLDLRSSQQCLCAGPITGGVRGEILRDYFFRPNHFGVGGQVTGSCERALGGMCFELDLAGCGPGWRHSTALDDGIGELRRGLV